VLEYKYDVDITEAIKAMGRFESRKVTLFRTVVIEAMRLIGVTATTDFMTVRSYNPETGLGGRTSEMLHINTRRLATSLLDGFYLRGAERVTGAKEGIREVSVAPGQVTGKFGSEVPYAAIHEYGGSIQKTVKSRRFFWAMWYNSKAPMWKALALTAGPIKIPARPYLRPAIQKTEPMIVDYTRQRLIDLTRKLER